MAGIVSYGGYVPWHRLNRMLIFKAMGWLNAGTRGLAKGEKAVANFDEDSLTMAVASSIDCLTGFDRSKVEAVYFSSTTIPFQERQNAGIIAGALGLGETLRAADFSGALKSGTTALISAIEAVESKRIDNIVVASSDCRLGKMGSPQEMIFGDGGAAFLVGNSNSIAEYKGSFSLSFDFVDHFRGKYAKYDRQWEDRWIRDLGYHEFIPAAITGILKKNNKKITDFAKVIYPCYYDVERNQINKMLGLTPEQVQDPMLDKIGEAGTAQSLMMLVKALEEAKPGDNLLVISFGNGCDALHFEVTKNIEKKNGAKGISGHLARKTDLDTYEKYLVWRNMVPADIGLRGDEDTWTRWSMAWRSRKAILGLCGSKCKKCGTPQYPPQRVCVNPDCGAIDQMEDYYFSDKLGNIFSFTGDNLDASLNPPSIYGNVAFQGGGRHMFNFTDCKLETLKVGDLLYFSFRVKYYDERRDITRYFWKAVPLRA